MRIHRIQIGSDEQEDRLLLRVSTTDGCEYRFWLTQGLQVLSLYPRQGQGLDMTLDTRLLHILAKLLRDAVGRTDWDIHLALHEQTVQAEQGTAEPARKLN
jgi:hypothetical protein